MNSEPRSINTLYFDPDQHPDNTLKAFNEFVEVFELRYDTQYPDPPKISIDTAIERLKFANTTEKITNPRPTLDQYDDIREEWRSKDRVAKILGMFSANRLYTDWQVAQPIEKTRKTASWSEFVHSMQEYYKPTENSTLKNYHFRELTQDADETFPSFCNRVEKEARHCYFKCPHVSCTAEETAIRDQIVIGTNNNAVREEALLKSWNLITLRKEGMKIESAHKGGAEIAGQALNKIGKYSYKNLKKNSNRTSSQTKKEIRMFLLW